MNLASQPRRHSAASACQWSLAARLLLVLLVWSGPVPVAHDHATLGNSVVGSRRFAEHLIRFHLAPAALAESCKGWHLHWIFPGEEESGLASCPSRGAIDRDVRAEELSAAESAAELAPLHPFDAPAEALCRLTNRNTTGSSPAQPYFLCGFARGLSLPESLGILRC